MKKYLAIIGFLAIAGGFAANTHAVAAYGGNSDGFSKDTIPADTVWKKHKKPGKPTRDTLQWPKDTMPHSLPPRL